MRSSADLARKAACSACAACRSTCATSKKPPPREMPGRSLRSTRLSNAIRHFIGSYLVALGGCDVLVFTGGIGENGAAIRQAVCKNMQWAGIELDPEKNQVRGKETKISKSNERTRDLDCPDQ